MSWSVKWIKMNNSFYKNRNKSQGEYNGFRTVYMYIQFTNVYAIGEYGVVVGVHTCCHADHSHVFSTPDSK